MRITPGRSFFLLMAFLLALFCGACSADAPSRITPSPDAPPTAPEPPAGATPSAAPTVEPGPVTLRWWTPDFLAPNPAQPGGALLEQALAEFTAAQQGQVRVQVEPKPRYGKGGLLDYLRTAQPVAPGVLPDIVALDIAELEQAVAQGALQPLDGVLDPNATSQLYPSAIVAGQFDGRSFAVPVALDIEHVMYDGRARTAAPATWTGLLVEKTPYIFPAASPTSAARATAGGGAQPAVLSHYLGAEYALDPATRRLGLEEAPLLRQLDFYSEAQKQRQLAPNAAELATLQDAQQSARLGETPARGSSAIVQTDARSFMARDEALHDWLPAAIPGWSNPSPPIINGWAVAIVTPDPARQQLAAELIAWLLAPEHNGPWTQAAGWLPVSPDALGAWEDTPYRAFLATQLPSAVAPPAGPESVAAGVRLHGAVFDVLAEGIAPQEAARRALAPAQ
jgi:ABC-type glycerol-3-phosphate transport system substrate-binding protein